MRVLFALAAGIGTLILSTILVALVRTILEANYGLSWPPPGASKPFIYAATAAAAFWGYQRKKPKAA